MTQTVTTIMMGGPLDGLEEDVLLEDMAEFCCYDRFHYYARSGLQKKIPFREGIDEDDPTPGVWTYQVSNGFCDGVKSVSLYTWVPSPGVEED